MIAPIALTQLALPLLRASGGAVLNITSDAAVEAYTGWGGYGAAKAALEQASNVLAAEEPTLRVWWADPGDLRTDMHQLAFPGEDISERPEPSSVAPAFRAAGHPAVAERPVPRGPPHAQRAGDLYEQHAGGRSGRTSACRVLEVDEPPERAGCPGTGCGCWSAGGVRRDQPPRPRRLRRAARPAAPRGPAGGQHHGDPAADVTVSAELAVHFSGPRPDASWLTELRQVTGKTTVPNGCGYPGQRLILPGGRR